MFAPKLAPRQEVELFFQVPYQTDLSSLQYTLERTGFPSLVIPHSGSGNYNANVGGIIIASGGVYDFYKASIIYAAPKLIQPSKGLGDTVKVTVKDTRTSQSISYTFILDNFCDSELSDQDGAGWSSSYKACTGTQPPEAILSKLYNWDSGLFCHNFYGTGYYRDAGDVYINQTSDLVPTATQNYGKPLLYGLSNIHYDAAGLGMANLHFDGRGSFWYGGTLGVSLSEVQNISMFNISVTNFMGSCGIVGSTGTVINRVKVTNSTVDCPGGTAGGLLGNTTTMSPPPSIVNSKVQYSSIRGDSAGGLVGSINYTNSNINGSATLFSTVTANSREAGGVVGSLGVGNHVMAQVGVEATTITSPYFAGGMMGSLTNGIVNLIDSYVIRGNTGVAAPTVITGAPGGLIWGGYDVTAPSSMIRVFVDNLDVGVSPMTPMGWTRGPVPVVGQNFCNSTILTNCNAGALFVGLTTQQCRSTLPNPPNPRETAMGAWRGLNAFWNTPPINQDGDLRHTW